jgi:peptidoglycan/LPS O-acetylase OafA/YrhL
MPLPVIIPIPNSTMSSVLTSAPELSKIALKHRDTSLDLLRFIGVLFIMIAHSQPPAWLFQLRNFGTPLLIVASALTVSKIYRNKELAIKAFYKKRLLKLTVPAWIFLTLYFTVLYVVYLFLSNGEGFPYSPKAIVKSYIFGDGGVIYLWILKVYLFIALITPFALRIKSSNRNIKLSAYFILLLAGYFIYEVLVTLNHLFVPVHISKSVDGHIFTLLAYTLLFLYGMRMDELKKKRILMIAVFSLIPFLAIVAIVLYNYIKLDVFYGTQTDKYPPRIYYLSYAFCCLNIMYILCTQVLVKVVPAQLITWLASNSLWVYLWHILGIDIADLVLGSTNMELLPSLVKASFILMFGITLTLLQNYLVQRYLKNSQNSVARSLATVLS